MIEVQVLGADQDSSLDHYLQEWLAHTRGRVRATTYAGYEYLIRCHAVPALGEVPLSELSALHFQRLYSSLLVPERHLSAGTVLNLHLVLTQALGQAVRWGILERNPVKGAQPPRPVRPEPVVIDPVLARRIVAALSGSAVELPGMLAIATGMRRGEILGLRRMTPRGASERRIVTVLSVVIAVLALLAVIVSWGEATGLPECFTQRPSSPGLGTRRGGVDRSTLVHRIGSPRRASLRAPAPGGASHEVIEPPRREPLGPPPLRERRSRLGPC